MREINLEFFAKIIFGTCHMRLNPVHQMNFSSFCSSEVFFVLYRVANLSVQCMTRVRTSSRTKTGFILDGGKIALSI